MIERIIQRYKVLKGLRQFNIVKEAYLEAVYFRPDRLKRLRSGVSYLPDAGGTGVTFLNPLSRPGRNNPQVTRNKEY